MGMIRAQDRHGFDEGSVAADWAVNTVRRSLHGARVCTSAPRNAPAFLADLDRIGALFRTAQDRMVGLQGAGLTVAPPGTAALTRHERRLLRAAAAAQAEDGTLVNNYLFKLAPHPQARPPLADAVTALATSLATTGYWFSMFPLPAPALRVARLHGLDLGAIRIAWARPDGENHVRR